MRPQTSNASEWTARLNGDLIRLLFWTVAWLATMAMATFGPELLWQSPLLTLLAVLVSLVVGLGMVRANILHLNVLDEMMQKIQLRAMALSLGIGIVGGLSYSLLDTTNLIAGDAEIGFVVMLMALTYIAGTVAGCMRYR